MKHIATTIVSKNYLAYARVLAKSWLQHHPDGQFFVFLVDRKDGYQDEDADRALFTLIPIEDIGIPGVGQFIYRYSIIELNTAVKPYILEYVLRRHTPDTVLYIDPDIWVFRPFEKIYSALESNDVVLIPHIRAPYFDQRHPSELNILQSGTYNLGFVGLRAGEKTLQLLEWWQEHLFADCVVDIPRGLFTDQKWMDLIPGYYEKTHILRDPGYNIAYWNMHERELRISDGEYFVDDSPLTFIHFSGYDPFKPKRLSKYQDRHKLTEMPVVQQICNEYRQALLSNGHRETSRLPYAYATLSNGVALPMKIVRNVMQDVIKRNIRAPDPLLEPDEFCKFLMRPHDAIDSQLPLLYHHLLKARPDLGEAFPEALTDPYDGRFNTWLTAAGAKEENILPELLQYAETRPSGNEVSEVFDILLQDDREDVFAAFPNMWFDRRDFDGFADWVASFDADQQKWVFEFGERPARFTMAHAAALRAAYPQLFRILALYFMRGDLQLAFDVLWSDEARRGFTDWLVLNRNESYLNLSVNDIALFSAFVARNRGLIEGARFLYQHYDKGPYNAVSVYTVDERRTEVRSVLSKEEITLWLAAYAPFWDPEDHVLAARKLEKFSELDRVDLNDVTLESDHVDTADFAERALKGLRDRREKPRVFVNFAGYVSSTTGMGESGRSMQMALDAAAIKHSDFDLPSHASEGPVPHTQAIFGWPRPDATATITVANADAAGMVSSALPRHYWSEGKNIGYWVWETEELPVRFEKADKRYDEIWTPSRHSADAIRKRTDKPVHVVPHTLDFETLDRIRPQRAKFGLPENKITFGFILDPRSVLERKNVLGLIEAYDLAFPDKKHSKLVIKFNRLPPPDFEVERIIARATQAGALIIDKVYSRNEVYEFLASLDVYVSLHRSEGFGLTCAEAMALRVPVIASAYSGNMEFMDAHNSLLVPTKRIKTTRSYGPYPTGTVWGDPDINIAAQMMRSMMEKWRRRELGDKARTSVHQALHPRTIGALVRALLGGPFEVPETARRKKVVERTVVP